MGLLNLMYLEAEKVYGCARCKVHLTEINEIISKVYCLVYQVFPRPSRERIFIQ